MAEIKVLAWTAFSAATATLVEDRMLRLAAFLVAMGVVYKSVIRPCTRSIVGLVKDVREMKETIDTVPDRFDDGAERMTRIEDKADHRGRQLDTLEEQFQLLADTDAQAIRTAIAASAARHVAVVTEDDVRVHWRD